MPSFIKNFAIITSLFLVSCSQEPAKNNEVKTINSAELKSKLDNNEVVLIDVRSTDEYKSEHIAGSVSVPLPILSMSQVLIKNKPIVTQCKSGGRGERGYNSLKSENPELEVYNLQGGIDGWKKDGFETIKNNILPLPQQIQIAAGTMVLVGTFLGLVVKSTFLGVPLFIGAGLIFAGVTGWCGLGKLIAKMPWNKN